MPHGRRARAAAPVAVLVLAIGLGAAGCSDDGGGGGTKSPSPTAGTPTAAPEPTDTASATETAGEGQEPADPAAAEAQIKKNFEAFFDPKTPLDKKAELLEDGDRLEPLMRAFSGSDQARGVAVKVTGVSFSSPTEAAVSYAMTVSGATVLPNGAGTAVLDGSTWKVSKETLCGLVGISGTAGPGCS
ncbi:hypothetical protein SRB5_33080 [Streptomyces sp. RB5]|uniref:Low molecular weight antigen MTB12-like C-terminal domain-containing protein n=1 Tax=Streptomyces smaragdinus TaxID=2585196 RepID=A0A7K0CI60_9ACTN|nr:hypothetical protein [Streptomyces smaragdinus]MQY13165.1 hypothetical protein [Streptomyces smaragdinus]